MMAEPKKYGLIISTKKSTSKPVKKLSVFDDDSSNDEDAAHKEVNLSLLQESQKKKQMKQTQIEIHKALEQDPNVYEYDTIYDQMEEKKKAATAKVPEKDKKPKYMEGLLKAAAARKRDFERSVDRQVQKEREKEQGEFDDKEAFVTEAFRQKMQEQAEEEERLKRQDAIDAANDVTKQKDLTLFYRNLLNRNVSLGGSFANDDATKSESVGSEDDKSKSNENESSARVEENPSTSNNEKHKKEDEKRSPRGNEKSSRGNDGQEHENRRHTKSPEHESRRHTKSPDRHRKHHDHSSRRRSNSDSDEDRRRQSTSSHRRDRKRPSKSDDDKGRHRHSDHSERRRTSRDDRKHSDHSESNRTSRDDRKDEDRKREHDSERNREDKNVSETDEKEPQTVVQETKESIEVPSEESKSKFAKRSTNETVLSAKERYLARKRARETTMVTTRNDDSDED